MRVQSVRASFATFRNHTATQNETQYRSDILITLFNMILFYNKKFRVL
jgi:hypothetical protein